MAKPKAYSYVQTPPVTLPFEKIHVRTPSIRDVAAAFEKIKKEGEYLAAWEGNQFPDSRYKLDLKNDLGRNNHFQGIQRLRQGAYVAISGGDVHDEVSHLFIVRMRSRRNVGSWRSNRILGLPPQGDEVVATISVDSGLWHAGGISVLGDVLAVPVYRTEPENLCKIVFYHMRDPEQPEKFDTEIARPGMRAGAAALTRLPSGYFLAAVWSDSDDGPHRFDFYLSKSRNILEGFRPQHETVEAKDVQPAIKKRQKYQAINFVNQQDGKLFLVAMHNTSDIAPLEDVLKIRVFNDKDFADLYEVVFPDETATDDRPVLLQPAIVKRRNRQFICEDWQANFDAATGVHVGQSNELRLYSAFHFRSEGLLKFNEYRPEIEPAPDEVTEVRDGWVDLFEHDHFEGRRLSIVGKRSARFENYRRIFVAGDEFGDEISSVRYQLPIGHVSRLYQHKNFRGDSVDLSGTGRVEKIADFKRIQLNGRRINFGDKVSSSRYLS